MGHRQGASRRPIVATALAAVAGALLASFAIAAQTNGSPQATDAGAGPCRTSAAAAAETTAGALRRSVRCLINDARDEQELPALTRSSSLQTAAQKHSKAMAATDCLAHRCPGEGHLDARIRKGGYLKDAETWEYAENTGCAVSAEAMVESWLASEFHRDNLLDRDFDDFGVGVTQKPAGGRCGDDYATFALVVGWRDAID